MPGQKSKIPIEEEIDLRREKVSLKSKMKRCTGGRSTESERKRITDSWSSKEERSTSLGRFEERYCEQMLVKDDIWPRKICRYKIYEPYMMPFYPCTFQEIDHISHIFLIFYVTK